MEDGRETGVEDSMGRRVGRTSQMFPLVLDDIDG
jgi:hypothetical protein